MTLQRLTAALLGVLEGCRLTAYRDTGGVWTIGYGHTKTAKAGMVITREEADLLLVQDMAPVLKLVQDRPLLEAAALASFGFNCGAGALRRVLAGAARLEEFVRSGGKERPGLVARRRLEAALIETARGT